MTQQTNSSRTSFVTLQAEVATLRAQLAEAHENAMDYLKERDEARALARRLAEFTRHLRDCASTYPYTRVPQACNCGLDATRAAFDAASTTWPP